MNVKIKSPEEARNAANAAAQKMSAETQMQQTIFSDALKELETITPDLGGFDELSALLSLPDEHFALLAPVFLEELEKSFNNPNDQLIMAQTLNASGKTVEDIQEEYLKLCDEIDNKMNGIISAPKCDFIKQLLGYSYNAAAATEGISKRKMLIPIEFCHPAAKMPTYAHLTDAGMDIYTVEDVVIHPGETKLIKTGVKVAVPRGYELQVRPKSGRSLNSKLRLSNAPATIDSGYRGEIGVIVDNIDPFIRSAKVTEDGRLTDIEYGSDITIEAGSKIAQLVLSEVPHAAFYEVSSVASFESDGRGEGGYGSTGDK